MTNGTKSIAARFSAAADTYGRHASIQRTVALYLAGLMRDLPPPARALEIGCGTGIFTEQLTDLFPTAKICALDTSSRMIKESKVHLADNANIEWITGSLNNIHPQPTFDLITSNSSLHWITPIKNTFRAIHTLLQPDGHFAFSINLKNTFKELHNARKRIAPHKKIARLPTTEKVLNALLGAGFSVISCRSVKTQGKFSSASEFLQTIHEQGLTSGPVSNSGTLLNRRELKEVVSYYDSHYKNSEGGVFATYDSLCILATEDKGS